MSAATEAQPLQNDVDEHEANSTKFNESLIAASFLVGLAVAAKGVDYAGLEHDLPGVLTLACKSGAHPILGFAGATASEIISNDREHDTIKKAGLAVTFATITNFAVEGLQSAWIGTDSSRNIFAKDNLPETKNDYMMALIGAGLCIALQRRKTKASKQLIEEKIQDRNE